jgi:hypothetical protein
MPVLAVAVAVAGLTSVTLRPSPADAMTASRTTEDR